jgi:hypothetical protein
MGSLQKTLDALKPYVLQIRYVEGIAVIDTVFKTGWQLPDSKVIKRTKGDDESLNYNMIYSERENIGIDELLEYISNVIKINLDREKKQDLLRFKVTELKEFFKKHSLEDLTRLKFVLAPLQQEIVTNEDDMDLSMDDFDETPNEMVSEPINQPPPHSNQEEYQLTEEDKEILEEERRAENYRKIKEQQKQKSLLKAKTKVELPPRQTISNAIKSGTCFCGPDEACQICIEEKSL